MLQIIYSLGGMKQATTSILPYILGYFISVNKNNITVKHRHISLIVILGLFCVMYVSEALGYFDVPNLVLDYYKSIVAAAVTVFFIQRSFENTCVQRIFDFSDKYSYGVYLTHHIFILGSLSVMSLTPYWYINAVIAFSAAIITGILLIWFSDKIASRLRKERK